VRFDNVMNNDRVGNFVSYGLIAAWAAAFGMSFPDGAVPAMGLFLVVAPMVSWAFAQDRDWSES
jgi:hypothetical protein